MTVSMRVVAVEIAALLRQRDFRAVKDALATLKPADILDILRELDPDNQILLFRLLPKDLAADTFAEMESDEQARFIQRLTDENLRDILNTMAPDDRTDLLEELPANVVKHIIQLLSPAERREALALLQYPEDSAGRIMTPEYVAARPYWSVRQTLDYIRRVEFDSETIYYIYVIDDSRHLLGVASLRELLIAAPHQTLQEIYNPDVIAARTTDDQETVVHLMKRYDLLALPVVDSEGCLVGIVTIDDAMDIQEEEATEDFQKMASMGPVEESYFHTHPLTLIRKRLGWLMALLVTESLTGTIMHSKNDLLDSFVVLAFFIPTIIGAGGNAGTQSSTLIIRGLALGEIESRRWSRVLFRELAIGLALGTALGLIMAARAFMTSHDPLVALTVGLALALVITLANVIGALLPLTARLFRVDPAVMAGPLITTFVDITALWIYLKVAEYLLKV